MADEPPAQRMARPRYKTLLDLPDDLLAEILQWLPFKDLVRLATCNKTFRRVIGDPNFVHRHLSGLLSELAAINKNDPTNDSVGFILIAPETFSNALNFSIARNDSNFSLLRVSVIPFRTGPRTINVIGSCNGLLCLTPDENLDFGRDVYLCNPVLRKYRKLNPEFSCFVDLIQNYRTTTYPVLGFGYHEAEGDYRVVRLIYNEKRPRAEIYSWKENSWRSVRAIVTARALRAASAFVDGRIYWIGSKNRLPNSWLIWFDLKDEVFGEMKLPIFKVDSPAAVGVIRWDDKATVYTIQLNVEGSSLRLWVQKRSDIGEISWVQQKKFLFNDQGVVQPLGFTWTGKPLYVCHYGYGNIGFVYSVEYRKFNFLGIEGPYTVDARFVESLALLLD